MPLVTDITAEMYSVSKRLEKASVALYPLSEEKSQAERVYRSKLAQELLKLKVEGMSIGMIADVAKGNVSDYLFERDVTESKFKCALESLDAIKSQLTALQSILKYQTEL